MLNRQPCPPVTLGREAQFNQLKNCWAILTRGTCMLLMYQVSKAKQWWILLSIDGASHCSTSGTFTKTKLSTWMNAKRCVWTYILVSWFCERLDGFPGAQSEILQKKGIKPLFLTAWSVWVYVKCVMKFVLRLSHYFYFVINITSRLERYLAVSLPPPCLLSLPTAMTQKSFHLISITWKDNVSFPFRHRKSA